MEDHDHFQPIHYDRKRMDLLDERGWLKDKFEPYLNPFCDQYSVNIFHGNILDWIDQNQSGVIKAETGVGLVNIYTFSPKLETLFLLRWS